MEIYAYPVIGDKELKEITEVDIDQIFMQGPEITDSEKHLHGQMKTPSRRYENGVTAKKQQYHGPGNS